MRLARFTLFGALFGFVLSRGRVSDYDTIAGMFRLTDLHLFGVIGAAIGTAAVGLWLVRRGGNRTITGDAVEIWRKAWQPGVIPGGLVLGAGWALTGACPGTSLVQVGEGKLLALFTVAGIVVGTYAFGRLRSSVTPHESRPTHTSHPEVVLGGILFAGVAQSVTVAIVLTAAGAWASPS